MSLLNISFINCFSQTEASCGNENFENSAAGVITVSTSVSGWTVKQLTNPTFICNYSVLTTPSVIPESNPDLNYVELYNAPNGIVDMNIGPSYSIFSVFGGTLSNAGPSLNPSIPQMFGSNFIRINKDGALNRNHSIEKTFSVTASNSLFRFAYLPVVQPKAGANCCEQPGIYIKFFNASASNSLLLCPSYSITAFSASCLNQTIPAPGLSVCPNNASAYYSKWKIIAVDLSNYIGSDITFKLGAMDCSTGCLHYAYAYVDAQCGPMELLINGDPVPATSAINHSVCSINSTTLQAPSDFLSYNWVGPNAFTSSQQSVVVNTAGTYTLTMGTGGGCSSITKYITIGTYPSASVTAFANPTLMCIGSSATLTASGLVTYSLNSSSSTPVVVVSPGAPTTYTFSGVDANNCFATTTVSVNAVSCVGLTSNETNKAQINVFPNPCFGEVTIGVNAMAKGSELKVLKMLGQTIFTETVTENKKEFKLNGILPGIYIIQYTEGNKAIITRKLIVN